MFTSNSDSSTHNLTYDEGQIDVEGAAYLMRLANPYHNKDEPWSKCSHIQSDKVYLTVKLTSDV